MSPVLPLAEIPTLSLLYKLKHLIPAANPVVSTPDQHLNNTISLLRHDITKLSVDCIVNAANESLLGGGGVDGAIHRAAGPGLLRECRTFDGCDTGDAKITEAYNLPCKKVIHAVGPVYWSAKRKQPGLQDTLLRGCYRKSLELAVQHGMKSIAFSALSTGVYGYPSDEAAEAALGEVKTFLDKDEGKKLDRVIFITFEMKDVKAYNDYIPKIFPPTEQDLSQSESASQGGKATEVGESPAAPLAVQLPDAPTNEPKQEGQPDAKKIKVDDTSDDQIEEGWERLEKSTESAQNGPAASHDDEPIGMESVKLGMESVKEKQEEATTANTERTGSNALPIENRFGKDW